MQVQVEKTGPCSRKVSVTIPASDVDAAFEAFFKRMVHVAIVPGFRPGKVPRSIVEKRFASDAQQEVKSKLVEDTLFKAMAQNEVMPVASPNVELGELARGADFSFTVLVEVKPDIELKKFKGLNVPKVDTTVAEADIGKELENLRQRSAQVVPVMLRDTVQNGDLVLVDYVGTIGGVPFEGGKADNSLVEIGAGGEHAMLPSLTEGMIGCKVPGERDIPVDFPADYPQADLAGKSATFRVKLKELKTKELPKLDDDFAKDMGEESLDSLRKKVVDALQQSRDDNAKNKRRRALLEHLVGENPFDLPPSMVDEQANRMIANTAVQIERMMGHRLTLSPEEINSLREGTMPEARHNVASALLLLEIAKVEKVHVDEEDLEKEIDKMVAELVAHRGVAEDRARSFWSDGENRENLRFRMLEDRVVDMLLEHAVEVEAPVAPAADATSESTPAGG